MNGWLRIRVPGVKPFFWVFGLGLFWYCSATELLLFCLRDGVGGFIELLSWFGGVFTGGWWGLLFPVDDWLGEGGRLLGMDL